MNYKDRISIEPGKRGGKPCIRGLRVTVYDVLDYLASGRHPLKFSRISTTWSRKTYKLAWPTPPIANIISLR